MNLAEATLVTTDVEPGWPLTRDGVAIGKHYIVDLDLLEWMTILNIVTGQSKELACIWVVAPAPAGWLPILAFGMKAVKRK